MHLAAEEHLAELLRLYVFEGWISTAHDVSEGGLAVTLAESCFGKGLGARVELPGSARSLFSETQARAIVAAPADKIDSLLSEAEELGVPAREIGEVGGENLSITFDGGTLDAEVAELPPALVDCSGSRSRPLIYRHFSNSLLHTS